MSPPDPVLPYESADAERPASAAATEDQLRRELPGGSATRHDPYHAFRSPGFRLFAAGNVMTQLGAQMQMVALGWELWKRTGDVGNLGWLGLVQAVPMIGLALPAGHVADAFSRRNIVLGTQLVVTLSAVGMAVLAGASIAPHRWVAFAYGLVFLRATALAFFRPARASLLPSLVEPKAFPNAITWNSTLSELASMIGPAVGGALIVGSLPLAYLASAAAQGCFVVAALFFRPRPVDGRKKSVPAAGDFVVGLRYVWRSKQMLGALTLDLLAVLFGGATYLLPVFADQRLHVGAVGFGWLRAAPALGAVAMSLCISHAPPFARAGRVLLTAVVVFGLTTIVFGLSKSFWLSLTVLTVIGACDNVSVVIRHTMLQVLTPDAMRGRVSAVNQVFVGSSDELGGLESGLTAKWFGAVPSVVAGGILAVVAVIGVAFAFPEVRRLRRLDELTPTAVAELSA